MSAFAGTALVTGGTGALGRAVVAELLERGADVVVPWIAERERDEVVKLFGSHTAFEAVEANLLEDGGPERAAAAASARGPLRALVNLAGGFSMEGRVHEAPPEELEKLLDLNLRTAWRACRAAIPAMLEGEGGSIVCVGTRAALEPSRGGAAYAVSKAAVMGLVRALDADYRDDGIRANAILPSVIDTPANRKSMPGADHASWVRPEEIATVVSFLCSDESSATSASEIPVYGRT